MGISIPSVETIPGLEASSPEFVSMTSLFSSSNEYAYFTSLIRFLLGSKNVISKGISSPAPYLPSQAMLTVVGTCSKFSVSTR